MVSGKLRVLYIVSSLKRCGPNNQLFNIVSNLDEASFSHQVLTLSSEDKESFWDKFISADLEVKSLRSHRVYGKLSISGRLSDAIKAFKPDVIHTQGYRADCLVSQLNKGQWNHVSTVRNIPQEDYIMTYGKVLGYFMCRKHIAALRNISRVVGVSQLVSDNLVNVFRVDNVQCIRNGVDVESYAPAVSHEQIRELKKQLNVTNCKQLFVSTGHLSPRKDPSFLIDGFIEADLSDTVLLLVGDGELKERLQDHYKDYSNIVFVGRSERISDYLKIADCYVSCSKSEGLPNSVLEALASGLYVVLSDIKPHLQIVEASEFKVGFTYQLGSKNEYVIAMKKAALITKDSGFPENARKLAQDVFSAKTMSRAYQEVYEDITSI